MVCWLKPGKKSCPTDGDKRGVCQDVSEELPDLRPSRGAAYSLQSEPNWRISDSSRSISWNSNVSQTNLEARWSRPARLHRASLSICNAEIPGVAESNISQAHRKLLWWGKVARDLGSWFVSLEVKRSYLCMGHQKQSNSIAKPCTWTWQQKQFSRKAVWHSGWEFWERIGCFNKSYQLIFCWNCREPWT